MHTCKHSANSIFKKVLGLIMSFIQNHPDNFGSEFKIQCFYGIFTLLNAFLVGSKTLMSICLMKISMLFVVGMLKTSMRKPAMYYTYLILFTLFSAQCIHSS